ncbi:MAG: hypothetical protein ACPGVU_08395, partial [Limisphaerales bacterium]
MSVELYHMPESAHQEGNTNLGRNAHCDQMIGDKFARVVVCGDGHAGEAHEFVADAVEIIRQLNQGEGSRSSGGGVVVLQLVQEGGDRLRVMLAD